MRHEWESRGRGKTEGDGKEAERQTWVPGGFCAVGSAGPRPNRDWELVGRAGWEAGGARPRVARPFVPLAPSHVFSDIC